MSKYLIQNLHAGCVGNAPVFWEKDNCGYSAQIEEARRFTYQEAMQTVMASIGKFAVWTEEQVLECSYLVADIQPLRRMKPAIESTPEPPSNTVRLAEGGEA